MGSENMLDMRAAVQLLWEQGNLHEDMDLSRSSNDIRCPICGTGDHSKQRKLHVSFDQGLGVPDGGSYVCSKCRISGGPISFYGLYNGISDNKEAAKHYFAYIDKRNVDVKKSPLPKFEPAPKKDVPTADVAVCDNTYRHMLKLISLSHQHRKHLNDVRGLSDAAINTASYRSFPLVGHEKIAAALLEQGCVLKGVPGFYKNPRGRWSLISCNQGILIPQRNCSGQIQGFQIRFDTVDKKAGEPRYISLSTRNFYHGAAAKGFCHFRLGVKGVKEVILTEGALKADIISSYTGYSVIAVPGVNSQTYLNETLEFLKSNGMRKIAIAFDADLYSNPFVKNALTELTKKIESHSIPHSLIRWDAGETINPATGETDLLYKGLDDWLLHVAKEKRDK